MGVVDLLEMVEIEDGDAERPPVPSGTLDLGAEAFVKRPVVGRPVMGSVVASRDRVSSASALEIATATSSAKLARRSWASTGIDLPAATATPTAPHSLPSAVIGAAKPPPSANSSRNGSVEWFPYSATRAERPSRYTRAVAVCRSDRSSVRRDASRSGSSRRRSHRPRCRHRSARRYPASRRTAGRAVRRRRRTEEPRARRPRRVIADRPIRRCAFPATSGPSAARGPRPAFGLARVR